MSPEAKIVMTLMVRDEIDVIAAMIEHHLGQGVDLIIVTDNGSVDGTREVLAQYAETGRVELHDYLQHDKNQSAVVSRMASRASTVHGATWVLNADADEFFVAVDPARTLRQALLGISTEIGSFLAPVVNMSGTPARSGPAFERLSWRDERDEDSLMTTVALHAHPSPDAVHVGRAGVTVQQGNHGVDIPSTGEPEERHRIEVLHFPWRSYEQYSTKIVNTGRSYDANPLLNPSPRHHGMRDYRFWKAGQLEHLYVVRHPEDGREEESGFKRDERVLHSLRGLLESGALRRDLLAGLLNGSSDLYSAEERADARTVSQVVIPLEIEHLEASTRWRDLYRAEAARAGSAERERDQARTALERLAGLPEARVRRIAGRALRRLRRLLGRP